MLAVIAIIAAKKLAIEPYDLLLITSVINVFLALSVSILLSHEIFFVASLSLLFIVSICVMNIYKDDLEVLNKIDEIIEKHKSDLIIAKDLLIDLK